MKTVIYGILFLLVGAECFGQLVRRKDYDAAFALQVGGEVGMLAPFGNHPGVYLRPAGGMKMTFPFTRKWFLGSEINYSELRYKNTFDGDMNLSAWGETRLRGEWKANWDMKQIQIPVYLKYMLNCNKASVLFGFYGAYVFDTKLTASMSGDMEVFQPELGETVSNTGNLDVSLAEMMEKWNAGVTVGYEHRIVKRLNLMLRVSAGLKDVMNGSSAWNKKFFPLQTCLTLSFDVLRIGDCGCD